MGVVEIIILVCGVFLGMLISALLVMAAPLGFDVPDEPEDE